MIQSHSSKKHSQEAIIAVCQGRSSLNASRRLCTEPVCRTSATSPGAIPADTQLLPFPPAAQHGKRGAARDTPVLCPRPHSSLQPFLFSVRAATRLRGLPLGTAASQERLCWVHPLACAPRLWLARLPFGWTQGSASLMAVLAVFSSSVLSPTKLFVPMFLKPISLCNFPKLLGNLLSFSRFPFLISIYTLNSSTSFFTHGMSLFLMLDYFLHSLIRSDLFHS